MAQTSGSFEAYLDGFVPITDTLNSNLDKQSRVSEYCNVITTKKMIERQQNVENAGLLSMIPENAIPPEITFKMGYTQAYTQIQWGGRVMVTEVMQEFDQRGLVTRLVDQAVDAAWKTWEFLGASVIDYGETANTGAVIDGVPYINTIGGDGLPLFSLVHTYNSSGYTYANRAVAYADPSEPAIDTQFSVVRNWKDNQGVPLDVKFKGLIVNPTLFGKAIKALKSRLEAYTANNAVSAVEDYMMAGMNLMEYPWISPTRWIIQTDAKQAGFNFFVGWKPRMKKGLPDPNTGSVVMRESMSCAGGSLQLLSMFLVA